MMRETIDMCAHILNMIGIASATAGSVVALISIMKTDPKTVGTWGEPEQRRKEAPQDKLRAYFGCAFIIIGGILQIVGQVV